MSTYLLLRSNKQTGPYSLDDLRGMGLKAYDLVWVEGKSAAWRYPGEIEELKSFAPPVEEQPFDRFFKRPAQTNQPLFSTTQTSSAPQQRNDRPIGREAELMGAAASTVYAAAPPAVAEPRIKPAEKIHPNQKSPLVIFDDDVTPKQENREPARTPVPTAVDPELAVVNDSYAKSYEERKRKMDEKITRPVRNASSIGSFLKPFAVGFGLASFLGLGIFIGITITNRGINSSKEVAQNPKDDVAANDGSQHALYRPKDIPLVTPPGQETEKNLQSNNLPSVDPSTENNNNSITEKKKARNKQKLLDSLNLLKPKPVVDSSALLATQKIAHAAESAALAKESVKNNIANYVSITGNKYNVGTFGGISDLQLTISNKSTYPLDLVVVEVRYIQSNKKIFKTENLYFRNIGGGSALMQEAPKSSRGIKVEYKITVINSKDLGLSYSGI